MEKLTKPFNKLIWSRKEFAQLSKEIFAASFSHMSEWMISVAHFLENGSALFNEK